MALSLSCSGSFSSDGDQMFMEDSTGVFNASTNVGGWGGSNPATTTVTTFQIICNWLSAGTTVTYNFTVSSGTITVASMIDTAGTTFNILSALTSTSFPFDSPDLFELTSVFGTAAKLPTLEDGQFQIIYKVVGVNSGTAYTYTTSTTFFRSVDLCCCLKELRLTADPNCDCNDVQAKVNRVEYWLTNAICAAETGKPNETSLNYFTKAQEICESDCGCGDC